MNKPTIQRNRKLSVVGDELGFALVISLMVLLVLTFLGIMALNSTTTELLISSNEKLSKTSFYRADSGIYTAPKVIRDTVSDRAMPAIPFGSPLTFVDSAGGTNPDKNFVNKILYNDLLSSTFIDFTLGNQAVNVEVTSLGSHENAGGSTEFGMSYDGAAKQSYHLLYAFESRGYAPNNAEAVVEATYKLMPGTAGGL